LTDLPKREIEGMQSAVMLGKLHPMQAKKNLAWGIVRDFHSEAAADAAAESWAKQFQQKAMAEDAERIDVSIRDVITADSVYLQHAELNPNVEVHVHVARLLVHLGIVPSRRAAETQVSAGVTIDGKKVTDKLLLIPQRPHTFDVKVGRQQKIVTLR
jgi:tyrosyl-tRNA synthetase